MLDLVRITDPMLHVRPRPAQLRNRQVIFVIKSLLETKNHHQNLKISQIKHFQANPRNWAATNIIKMIDLVRITHPMLHVRPRLAQLRNRVRQTKRNSESHSRLVRCHSGIDRWSLD